MVCAPDSAIMPREHGDERGEAGAHRGKVIVGEGLARRGRVAPESIRNVSSPAASARMSAQETTPPRAVWMTSKPRASVHSRNLRASFRLIHFFRTQLVNRTRARRFG